MVVNPIDNTPTKEFLPARLDIDSVKTPGLTYFEYLESTQSHVYELSQQWKDEEALLSEDEKQIYLAEQAYMDGNEQPEV